LQFNFFRPQNEENCSTGFASLLPVGFSFGGRPRNQYPNGRPEYVHCRIAGTASSSPALTRCAQSPSASRRHQSMSRIESLSSLLRCAAALDQRYSSGRATIPARTGFRSTYTMADHRWLGPSMQTNGTFCHKCPVRPACALKYCAYLPCTRRRQVLNESARSGTAIRCTWFVIKHHARIRTAVFARFCRRSWRYVRKFDSSKNVVRRSTPRCVTWQGTPGRRHRVRLGIRSAYRQTKPYEEKKLRSSVPPLLFPAAEASGLSREWQTRSQAGSARSDWDAPSPTCR